MTTLTPMAGEVTVEMLTIKPSRGQSTFVYPRSMQRSCKDSGHIHHRMQTQVLVMSAGENVFTDSGMKKGLPAVWIVSKAVTDDIISGQTVDCSYQQGEDVLTGLTHISLER